MYDLNKLNSLIRSLGQVDSENRDLQFMNIRSNVEDDELFKTAFAVYLVYTLFKNPETSNDIKCYEQMYGFNPRERTTTVIFAQNNASIVESNYISKLFYPLGLHILPPVEGVSKIGEIIQLTNLLEINDSDTKSLKKIGTYYKDSETHYFLAIDKHQYVSADQTDVFRMYMENPNQDWIPYLKEGLILSFPEGISGYCYREKWSDEEKLACLKHYCELKEVDVKESVLNTYVSLGLDLEQTVTQINADIKLNNALEINVESVEF